MFETVEKIHRALGIESTWAFVLIIAFGAALIFGTVGGAIAWIVDAGYKHSSEYKADHPDPKQQTATATNNSAPQSVAVPQSTSIQGAQSARTTTMPKSGSVKTSAQKEGNTQKRQSSKTPDTGPDMKMLADVMAGKPVPASSPPSKAKAPVPAGLPPPGTYRCPDGKLVPEHHAEQCGASNIVMRYNTFDGGPSNGNPAGGISPVGDGSQTDCALRNSAITNNVYRNGVVPDLSSQCDSQFSNNLTEGQPQGKDRPQLKIGGKENDIGHNTFPEMNVTTTDTSERNKLHDNLFQATNAPQNATGAKNGKGADLGAINKAQTQNRYPGAYPDVPWPVAKTVLHGTPSSVADQLAAFIDDAHKIVAIFIKDDNSQSLAESEKAWEAEAQSIIATNLGKQFAQEFDEAASTSTTYPPGHNARGGSICNLIDAKVSVLSTFVNQLRAATH
jgi:hypothetical protein